MGRSRASNAHSSLDGDWNPWKVSCQSVLVSQHPPTEGKTETVQLLLKNKADVNLQDNNGWSGGPFSSRSMVC